jgi:argininosuccinate lyase
MDMATTLAALKTGIITRVQARAIAKGIDSLALWGSETPDDRPSDYLDVQSRLVELVGPDATRMHAGRSRQDMLATLHRFLLRDRVFAVYESLVRVREAFLNTGLAFSDIAVPTYTNGVQAQPALFGHIMSGYEAPLARSAERYRESFARLNQSPLGSAALAGSRFELDRDLISSLLGFDCVLENTFDATQLGLVDSGVECAQIAASLAVSLNMFTQDIHAVFRNSNPWIRFRDSAHFSPSTLMPQKRNPVVLNRTRRLGSDVIGASITATLVAHNVGSGFTDYKRNEASSTLELTVDLLSEIASLVESTEIDSQAALRELLEGFTTTSELAALLQEKTDVPLGITHEFASEIVDFCRSNSVPLEQVPQGTLESMFAAVLIRRQVDPIPPFPLSSAEFVAVIHPASMILNYQGCGSSSPEEVRRMLEDACLRLENDRSWARSKREELQTKANRLDNEFAALLR